MTLAADARLTDADLKAREAKAKEAAAALAQIKKDFNETFASPAGQRSLRKIMEICGWERSPVVGDQFGNPLSEGTIYNNAQQNVYRTIRKYIRKDILIPVEHQGLEQDEVDMFS